MLNDPNCRKCPLGGTSAHTCIPSRGSDKPRLLFVGQAPGVEESYSGRCFVGPAGRFLTDAIKKYNLLPARLTNAVKCFPPGDRDPNKKELLACRGYLDAEINFYKPEFVVTLGNTPLKLLTGKTGVNTWSGQVVGSIGKSVVFSLFHPSYILRYPRDKAKWEAHLRELGFLLRPLARPRGPAISRIFPHEFQRAWREMTPPIAFDFETNGAFKPEGGFIRTVSISDGKTSYWMEWDEEAKRFFREFIEDPVEKTAHNSPFETRWSLDEFGCAPKNLKYDTYLIHHLVDENSAHGLNAVASQILGASDWDVAAQMKEKGWSYETIPLELVGPYNALDSYWTARLVGPLMERLRLHPGLEEHYRTVVLPQAKVCARLERRGIKIDVPWCKRVDEHFESQMLELEGKIRSHKQTRTLEYRLGERKRKLNLNSRDQMQELFYDIIRLPVVEETDGGKPSVREAALLRLKDQHPIVPVYLDWKTKQTLRNNFLQKFPKFADERGIVRSSFNPAFVVTGRLSVSKPPFQAIPEDDLVRGMVVSRFDGGTVASIDYRQLEVRLVASEAGEDRLLQAIVSGDDLHSITAQLVFGSNFTKHQRSIAKRLNFGVVYGISAFSISAEFGMSPDEAERILRRFWDAYPAIRKWMDLQHAHLEKYGWVANRFGRVRRFPEWEHWDLLPDWKKDALRREAGNFPIASHGADVANLAMVLVDTELRQRKTKSMLINQVHDSLLLDVHPSEQHWVPARCADIMTGITGRCPWLKVKLDVDVSVTERWGGATNVLEKVVQ